MRTWRDDDRFGTGYACLATTPNYRYAEVVGEQQNLVDTWDAITTWFTHNVPPATLLGVHLLGRTINSSR